jgi:hypothetical protein
MHELALRSGFSFKTPLQERSMLHNLTRRNISGQLSSAIAIAITIAATVSPRAAPGT